MYVAMLCGAQDKLIHSAVKAAGLLSDRLPTLLCIKTVNTLTPVHFPLSSLLQLTACFTVLIRLIVNGCS